jgi:Leu/Phe-tRNA-protein transferase
MYGSRMHMDDLKQVQAALHIHYQLANDTHYQDVCPPCRRKNIALTQDSMWISAARKR